MYSYRTVYSFPNTNIVFPYFHRMSLNIYYFSTFILYECCLQIFNFVTYFRCVCIGRGVEEMDLESCFC